MTATRLRHLAEINPPTPEFDRLPDSASVTFVPLEAVWPGGRLDVSRARPKDEVSQGYTRFRVGDIIVPKITPTFEANRSTIATGLAGGVAAGTTELHVVRPSSNLEVRYAGYLLSSKPFLDEGKATMIGVAGQKRVPDDFLRDLAVPVLDVERQRAIADFLDAETARIDALIAKKRRLDELLDEAELAMVDAMFGARYTQPTVRLARVARLQTGLTLDAARDPGPSAVTLPYLRVANVQAGHLDLAEVKEVTVPRDLAQRCSLRLGDVLMTEGGDLDKLGRGTVWRGDLPDCLHQNHVFAVRPDRTRLLPDYLAMFTRTSAARRYFESTGTRSTNLASTNSSKVLDFRVPILPVAEQRSRLDRYEKRAESIRRCRSSLSRQIDLLQEHRQALITAAVTGELDVPGGAA